MLPSPSKIADVRKCNGRRQHKLKRSRTRTPEQQRALEELRALRNARDKCWSCGQAGHMREQCKEKASEEDRAAFATKKEKLKAIINNGREA